MNAFLSILIWLTMPDADFHAASPSGCEGSWNLSRTLCRRADVTAVVTNTGIWQIEMCMSVNTNYWYIIGPPMRGPITNTLYLAVPNDGTNYFRITQKTNN